MSKRKKSLVGYTDDDIFEQLYFLHGVLPSIYFSEAKYRVGGIIINPLKVRITVEEIT